MEASGLYAAARETGTPWIVAKAVCDWADGHKGPHKKQRQKRAAHQAVDFVLHAISQGGFASHRESPVAKPSRTSPSRVAHSELERIEQKRKAALNRYQRLSEKPDALQKSYDLETRTSEKLRLEPLIEEVESERRAVEDELSALESGGKSSNPATLHRVQGQQTDAIKVFLCYSQEDRPFVDALEKLLDEHGINCWRDVYDLKAGRVEAQIDRAIEQNPLVLLVLSERSVESDWVEWEASRARDLERSYRKAGQERDVLCPIALDQAWKDCTWPQILRRQIADYHVLDFSGWKDDHEMARQFARLYEGVILNYSS